MANTETKLNEYDIIIWQEVVFKKRMTITAESSEEAKQMIHDAIDEGDAPWDVADDYDDDQGDVKRSSMDLYITNDDGDDEFIVEFGG